MESKLRKTEEGERNISVALNFSGKICRAGEKMDGKFPINFSVCRAGPLLGPEVSASLDPREGEEQDQILKCSQKT